MRPPSSSIVAGQKLAKSLRFAADQKYSTGLSSGAYAGNHSMRSHCRCVLRKTNDLFDRCTASRSISKMSFPDTWRLRCLMNVMNSGVATVPRTIRRYNFGFLPRGVATIVPVTERLRHRPGEDMIGVFPFGAQLRRTVGLSDIPDSSRNPIRARIFTPFFGCEANCDAPNS